MIAGLFITVAGIVAGMLLIGGVVFTFAMLLPVGWVIFDKWLTWLDRRFNP